MGPILALLPSEDGSSDEPVKVPKGRLANRSASKLSHRLQNSYDYHSLSYAFHKLSYTKMLKH